MQFDNATKLDRKSGVRGTKKKGEALRLLLPWTTQRSQNLTGGPYPRISYWAWWNRRTSCGFPQRKPHTRPWVVLRIGNPSLSAHFAPDVGFREPRPFAPRMHPDLGYRQGPKDDTSSAVVSHI
jgi:hypothetical protein